MRALVVYESMYGNTHVVAVNVAAGLAPLVSKQGTLLGGEAARARAWGAMVGEEASSVTALSQRRSTRPSRSSG